MQDLGLVTLEHAVCVSGGEPSDHLHHWSGDLQDIPSVSDVPVVFNVSLLDRAPNPKAIFSSKVRALHGYSVYINVHGFTVMYIPYIYARPYL